MTDILEQARSKSSYLKDSSVHNLIDDLVAEIVALRADNERMKKLLSATIDLSVRHIGDPNFITEREMAMLQTIQKQNDALAMAGREVYRLTQEVKDAKGR